MGLSTTNILPQNWLKITLPLFFQDWKGGQVAVCKSCKYSQASSTISGRFCIFGLGVQKCNGALVHYPPPPPKTPKEWFLRGWGMGPCRPLKTHLYTSIRVFLRGRP